jgi:hypothetical protein
MRHQVSPLLAVAGLATAAAGQVITTPGISVSLDLTWQEDPAFPHNDNGVLEPGEHALILMSESFIGQGSSVSISPPLGAYSVGDIEGFGGAALDLLSGSADGSGSYNGGVTYPASASLGPNADTSGTSGYGIRSHFRLGGNIANGQPVQSGFAGIGPGQFPGGEPTNISMLNPITNLERLGWSPTSYAQRTTTFSLGPSSQAGAQAIALYLFFDGGVTAGWGYVPFASVTFGSVDIPIVPAPAGLSLILAVAAAPRRPQRMP